MFAFQFQYDSMAITWLAVAAGSLFATVLLLWKLRPDPVHRRLETLAGDGLAAPSLAPPPAVAGRRPRSGGGPGAVPHLHGQEPGNSGGLRERMLQAGIYSPGTWALFYVLRCVLLVAPIAAGFWAGKSGWLLPAQGLLLGVIVGLAGILAPGLWLDRLKRIRQTKIRRALPDALDVMSVCLQGGLSLSVALAHVARELNLAHPALAAELNIMERQIQMGRSTGDAIREMANRFDLDELRSMSSVITQAERIGASVATALELFADSMRVKRHQRAEELAHKASVKMLFPTLIFIFPAIFIVILGPAVIRVYYQVVLGLLGGGS